MEQKNCQNCKQAFTIEADDFEFYKKVQVPAPTFCPLCRFLRRLAYRNERKLFRVKDAFTEKDIFSLYPAEAGRKMLNSEEWYGDSWDGLEYAREYDFSQPFFKQLFELDTEVPALNLNVSQMNHSDYCANANELKNCYLIFAAQFSENCMYGVNVDQSHDSVDNSHVNHAEKCYECFWSQNCYQCYFCIMCVDSRNMWFSRDCLGCNDCFGCANLRKKQYCIFNEQFTKEEYKQKIDEMKLDTASGVAEAREKARAFWVTQPTKFNQGIKNVNSTGSYVTECKNVNECFQIRESENLRYCQDMQIPGNKDCMDVCQWGERTELCYETSGSGSNAYAVKFSWDCWPSVSNCEYSMHLRSCSDCFGCVGLKKKQYCILNKQYSKDEYYELVEKIKQHMNEMPYVDGKGLIYKYGEFFPIELAPYGYNNTLVQDHAPLTEDEAIQKGYQWIDPERGNYGITKEAIDLSNSITDVSDEVLKDIIACGKCSRPYRIMPDELVFLRNENLPLPRLCIDCRHLRRIANRLKSPLYDCVCMCSGENDETGKYKNLGAHDHGVNSCPNEFRTGYSKESQTIVYCETCYQQEAV